MNRHRLQSMRKGKKAQITDAVICLKQLPGHESATETAGLPEAGGRAGAGRHRRAAATTHQSLWGCPAAGARARPPRCPRWCPPSASRGRRAGWSRTGAGALGRKGRGAGSGLGSGAAQGQALGARPGNATACRRGARRAPGPQPCAVPMTAAGREEGRAPLPSWAPRWWPRPLGEQPLHPCTPRPSKWLPAAPGSVWAAAWATLTGHRAAGKAFPALVAPALWSDGQGPAVPPRGGLPGGIPASRMLRGSQPSLRALRSGTRKNGPACPRPRGSVCSPPCRPDGYSARLRPTCSSPC